MLVSDDLLAYVTLVCNDCDKHSLFLEPLMIQEM